MIAFIWHFFDKNSRTGSRFTRRKWNYYLWVRRARTDWKTSTTPSYCIRSKTMLSVMKTPVRPTPALQWTVIGPSWPNCSLVLWTCPMKSMKASPDLGTPEKYNAMWLKIIHFSYLSALDFWHSPVWNFKFDELDFFPSLNWIFAGYTGSKNPVQTGKKIQFIKLEIWNWRMSKIKCR